MECQPERGCSGGSAGRGGARPAGGGGDGGGGGARRPIRGGGSHSGMGGGWAVAAGEVAASRGAAATDTKKEKRNRINAYSFFMNTSVTIDRTSTEPESQKKRPNRTRRTAKKIPKEPRKRSLAGLCPNCCPPYSIPAPLPASSPGSPRDVELCWGPTPLTSGGGLAFSAWYGYHLGREARPHRWTQP